jgi:hypothetical protein
MREVHSFHALEANIWRWAPSCPRNPNWVTTSPSTAARISWNHELPSMMIAAQTSANAAIQTAMRLQ